MTKAEIADAAEAADQSPLEFMLAVMNDRTHDVKFRAQMAQAAAPYVHGRPGEEKGGKKAAVQEKANEIGRRFAPLGPPTSKTVN